MAGNYTCAAVKFYLERTYGYYLAQVYLPSILVVILSWVSFWLDIDAVPARISLGLLTGMYCLAVRGGDVLLTSMLFRPGSHWDC